MNIKLLYLRYLFIVPILLSVAGNRATGAVNEIDSLAQLILTQQDNTEKVDNLILLVKKLNNNHPDSARQYCDQALRLSYELDYREGAADAVYYIASILKNKGDINSANEAILRYLAICDSLKDDKRLAKGYYQYGNLLRRRKQTDSALFCFYKGLLLASNVKDTTRILIVYNALGNVFLNIQAYDSAATYFHKAAHLCEKTGQEKYLGTIYTNLGKVYLQNNNYEDARIYLHQGLEINKKYNRQSSIALAYTRLGNVANLERNFEEAIGYYKKAEPIYNQLNDQAGIHHLHLNYGEVYQKQGKYELAINHYDKALKYYLEQDDVEGIIIAMMNKATALSMMGKHEQALLMFDTCLILTYEADDKLNRVYVLNGISETLYEMDDFKGSRDYLDESFYLKDTVFNLEKAEIIADLKLKYEKEKDQARILALENENLEKDLELSIETNQKNIYLFTGSGIIIIILFLFIFLRHRARKEKIIAVQKIRQLEEEKKVLAAKALVEGQEEERKRIARELHDGLGVLLSATKMQFSSIKDKSPENKQLIDKATELLDQATGDVRKISHNMMPGLLMKYGLAEAVEDLFERLDETEGLSAVTEIAAQEERLPENQEIMFYRIIQELVNNTLKHAEAKNIKLKTQMLPGQLEVIYTDDGKGFVVEEKLESRSIGLQSIQSRVNFLNGKLVIESKPGAGVKYIIHIPV